MRNNFTNRSILGIKLTYGVTVGQAEGADQTDALVLSSGEPVADEDDRSDRVNSAASKISGVAKKQLGGSGSLIGLIAEIEGSRA